MGTRYKIAISLLSTASALCPFHAIADESSARFNLKSSDAFIIEKQDQLAITKSDTDVFGLPQDPNKKVQKAPAVVKNTPKAREIKILIDQEITKLAERTQVIRRSMIVDGKRTYSRNQEIEVQVKGKSFPLKIVSITPSKIIFQNKQDKSYITLDMNNKAVLGSGNNETPSFNNPDDRVIDLNDK